MKLRSLEALDPGRLLRLEADLSDTNLDGVIKDIQGCYSLANVVYVCPGFPGAASMILSWR
jgi:hypothetical protein